MTEVLCDGMPPVIDRATAREYQCTRGSDCPADSYCHLQFGKCCQEGILNKWYTDREKVIKLLGEQSETRTRDFEDNPKIISVNSP